MENKHTPGPWKIKPKQYDPAQGTTIYIYSPGNRYICLVGVSDTNEPETDANAALIAAAPDLYESLKGFLEHVLCNYDLTERENKKFAELANSGLAAIAKAETV